MSEILDQLLKEEGVIWIDEYAGIGEELYLLRSVLHVARDISAENMISS